MDRAGFEHLLARRAVEAGADFKTGAGSQHDPSSGGGACKTLGCDNWRILASGGLSRRGEPHPGSDRHDRLVALVAVTRPEAPGRTPDSRLIVEAGPDGWAYGVAGPDNLHCVGVVTDAEALAGSRPNDFASRLLAGTERLAAFAAICPTYQAVPVHCRWLSVRAGQCSVRIGDAQASFDPVAGRGLWEAIRMAEAVAVALDTDPDQLD